MNTSPEVTFFTALFLQQEAIHEAASLIRPEDFNQDEQRDTFGAMLELSQTGHPIDVVHVIGKLRDRGYQDMHATEIVARLLDGAPIEGKIRDYAALVRESSRKRRFLSVLDAALRRAEQEEDPEDTLRDTMETLWELQADRIDAGPFPARAFVPDFLNQAAIEREHGDALEGLSTGLGELDDLTTGLRPGELWIAGALPGRGKTAFGMQIAREAASKGIPALVFSLEMTRAELTRRLLGNEMGANSMRRLRFLRNNDWTKMLDHAADLAAWPLYVDDAASLTATELAARGRTAIRERGIKLVVVDYLQLLRGKEREIRERVGNATNILRQLAKDTLVPVLALSQLRRPGNLNDRPTMLDLKESGDIEAHAHTVLLLYQPIGGDGRGTGEDEVIIGKQRNGPLAKIDVYFDRRTLRFLARTTAQKAPE